MVYKWNRSYPLAPEVVGGILETLPEITATAVVDYARPKDSPLHSLFEWDDSIAAEEHRKHQARVMIANIRIVEADKPVTRAFLNIRTVNADSTYIATTTVMADAEMRAQVLNTAMKELSSFRRKYAGLAEMARLFDVIDDMTVNLFAQPAETEQPQPTV